MFYQFRPYVPVARRRKQAEREVAALRKKGKNLTPVVMQDRGRTIARTFWGDAWCKNLEAYSDYANRLPRGRTYVRNGSVLDLQVATGAVTALVQGSSLYRITVQIRPLAAPHWKSLVGACSGHIGSLVELLRGGLSHGVMKRVTEPKTGLFPAPPEISLACTCPDWATMCKHVAAALYGVGVRLDERPELLFTLRGVDPADLIARAAAGGTFRDGSAPGSRLLDASRLSDVFGVEIDQSAPAVSPRGPRAKRTLEDRVAGLLASVGEAGMAQLARSLGTSKGDLVTPMAVLLSEGRIHAEGAGRATLYRAAAVVGALPQSVHTSRRTPTRGTVAAGRRSHGTITEVISRLHAAVVEAPGRRMEQIAHALGLPTSALALPAKRLMADGLVVTRGVRRATRYFPAA